jgi:CxxC-x17-CxxC domain-containing protein
MLAVAIRARALGISLNEVVPDAATKGAGWLCPSSICEIQLTGPLGSEQNLTNFPIIPRRIGEVMDFFDRELRCISCGETFVFSAGEQVFFHDKGFQNDPRHCKRCKSECQKGKPTRSVETRVKCSACGADTTVPFKLTQNRPVLCRSCFTSREKKVPA